MKLLSNTEISYFFLSINKLLLIGSLKFYDKSFLIKEYRMNKYVLYTNT